MKLKNPLSVDNGLQPQLPIRAVPSLSGRLRLLLAPYTWFFVMLMFARFG